MGEGGEGGATGNYFVPSRQEMNTPTSSKKRDAVILTCCDQRIIPLGFFPESSISST